MKPDYSAPAPNGQWLGGSEESSLLYLRKNWPRAGLPVKASFQFGFGGGFAIRPLSSTVSKSKSMRSSAARSLTCSFASREPRHITLPVPCGDAKNKSNTKTKKKKEKRTIVKFNSKPTLRVFGDRDAAKKTHLPPIPDKRDGLWVSVARGRISMDRGK